MIRELITYLCTSATKEARAFGHLYESIAIKEREKRCQPFWLSHRTNCKKFITQATSTIRAHQRVLVLGSGPLHEIPLVALASVFEHVDLVDVVHLKETVEKYKAHHNVHFIQADISQLESTLLREKKIANTIPTQFLENKYDLVISANLLSQLAYHLRNFLEKNASPKLYPEELDRFAYQVSFDHYQYLAKFKCPVILITDTETHLIDARNELLEVQTPYINFTLPPPQEQWWWNLAPIPEVSKDYSVKMKVSAFILNF